MATLIRDRYEPLAVVGQGGEAQVVKAFDHQLEQVVAMKIRLVPEGARRDEVLREARILVDVPPNPHLPLVREDFFDDSRYVVVMDWVEGTDLSVLLKSQGRPGLAPSNVLRWMADAASALTHLHTQPTPVVHGDVKPAEPDPVVRGRIVLVDFGLSSSPNVPGTPGGTVGYVAPEVAAGGSRPERATSTPSPPRAGRC